MFLLPLVALKDHVIAVSEGQIQELNQQLIASKQVIALLQQNLQQNETTIKELNKENQDLRQKCYKKPNAEIQKDKVTLRWKLCDSAPHDMIRGSATVCGNLAYFRRAFNSQVLSYNLDTKEWLTTLPECPAIHFSLTVVRGLVTAVGGVQPYNYTNALFSLMEQGGRQEWVEHFPPMQTKRKLTAVICSGKALVVAGGEEEGKTKRRKEEAKKFTTLNTVEVMDINTLKWSTASSLPQPISDATATVCGDRVYVVGGKNQHGDQIKLVFTCFLNALLQSESSDSLWNTVANVQVERTTCVTLNGQLLAVGGESSDSKITNNVYSYNTETDSWEVISHMPTPRCWCVVTALPGNQLMVVGGEIDTLEYTDKVEISVVV